MDNLVFLIQGSRAKPYKVTFKGFEENLEAVCTCPAGRNGQFCKHVALILNGNESKIVEGLDKLQELLERAKNSPLINKVQTHRPAPPKAEDIDLGPIKTFQDLIEYTAKNLEESSNWSEHKIGEDGAEYLSVFMQKYYKNGKPYKKPTLLLEITFAPYAREAIWDEEAGHWVPGEVRKKERPWYIDGRSYSKFPRAALKFIEQFKQLINSDTPEIQ